MQQNVYNPLGLTNHNDAEKQRRETETTKPLKQQRETETTKPLFLVELCFMLCHFTRQRYLDAFFLHTCNAQLEVTNDKLNLNIKSN